MSKEQKLFDKAETDLSEIYSLTFNSSPSPIVIASFDEDKFFLANESFLRLVGLNREEIIGFRAPDLKIGLNNRDRNIVKQILNRKKWFRNLEYDFLIKTGEKRSVLLSAELVEIKNQKSVLYAIVDITDRKAMEEELRKARNQLEERVKERTRELEKLNGSLLESYRHLGIINRQISIFLNLNKKTGENAREIVEYVLNSAISLSRADAGIIYAVDENDMSLRLLASNETDKKIRKIIENLPLQSSKSLLSLITKRIRLQGMIQQYNLKKLSLNNKINYFVMIPLAADGKVRGSLFLGFFEVQNLSIQELDFFEAFAMQAAVALSRLHVFFEKNNHEEV